MDDGSSGFIRSLKSEWQLLWASLLDGALGENQKENLSKDLFSEVNFFQNTNANDFKAISSARQRLFQVQESLKKEVQLRQSRIEEKRLLGYGAEEEERVLDKLLDEGLKIENRIAECTERMEEYRRHDTQEAHDIDEQSRLA